MREPGACFSAMTRANLSASTFLSAQLLAWMLFTIRRLSSMIPQFCVSSLPRRLMISAEALEEEEEERRTQNVGPRLLLGLWTRGTNQSFSWCIFVISKRASPPQRGVERKPDGNDLRWSGFLSKALRLRKFFFVLFESGKNKV